MSAGYSPPPYELLLIKKQSQAHPQNDGYDPRTVINNLLTIAETAQTEVTESNFTEWRNQLTTNLDALVEHAHLIKPSDLISLLQDGIAAPLECFDSLQNDKTSLCFPDRCRRIGELAKGLAEYLKEELREKIIALGDETSEPGESHNDNQNGHGIFAFVKALFSASTGVWTSNKGESVTVHPALTVTMSMLAAAIGLLSLHDGRNAFTNMMKEVDVSAWNEYSACDEDYLGSFWARLLPEKEERESCKCSQCRSYLMMLVGWRLSSGKYGVLHIPFF